MQTTVVSVEEEAPRGSLALATEDIRKRFIELLSRRGSSREGRRDAEGRRALGQDAETEAIAEAVVREDRRRQFYAGSLAWVTKRFEGRVEESLARYA